MIIELICLLLSKCLEVVDVMTKGINDSVHIVILDAVFLAGLLHDGGDAGIVGL